MFKQKLIVITLCLLISLGCGIIRPYSEDDVYLMEKTSVDELNDFLQTTGVRAVEMVKRFKAGEITKDELLSFLYENYPEFVYRYKNVLERMVEKADHELHVLEVIAEIIAVMGGIPL